MRCWLFTSILWTELYSVSSVVQTNGFIFAASCHLMTSIQKKLHKFFLGLVEGNIPNADNNSTRSRFQSEQGLQMYNF